jgi:hypothetical protein
MNTYRKQVVNRESPAAPGFSFLDFLGRGVDSGRLCRKSSQSVCRGLRVAASIPCFSPHSSSVPGDRHGRRRSNTYRELPPCGVHEDLLGRSTTSSGVHSRKGPLSAAVSILELLHWTHYRGTMVWRPHSVIPWPTRRLSALRQTRDCFSTCPTPPSPVRGRRCGVHCQATGPR